ncbi:DUF3048 domain-containing protein [Nocardioides sp.]|uniref:DUF3048 domain-containing protein n=1 Tax=Nocardioides sp. TaxID=35761 RepID=UPI002B8485D4|nr:DUF3048 domain-containing protein [Nocardioides sp.]HXH80245.1 DUF3048 domain-containing protein [Nocardioides sp.]
MHPRLRRIVAALAASALLTGLAACGGDEKSPEASPSSSSEETGDEATETPEPPALWPLTGLEVKGELPSHPVLVTKVDNTSSSSPQIGLGSADMVVEELVEGGMTRLAAFYYSDVPPVVGPVRSMRASDIGIVPTGAHVITSGAAAVTLARVKKAGIPFVTEGAKGIYRDNGRSAPYNLFSNPNVIAKGIKGGDAPEPYLEFGTPADYPGKKPARNISAGFGGHTTTWAFQGGKYVNTNSYAAQGDAFPATSVLVLRVRIGDAGYRDPSGYPVPETMFEGTGPAQLFHAGKVVQGTWSKDGLNGAIKLSTDKGALTVPAGRIWIELVPQGTGNVTWAK